MGVLGYSESIEPVAERRYFAEWGRVSDDPQNFDILVGVEDCRLVGRKGWILVGDNFYSALVVDCNQKIHIWPFGYLADINRGSCQDGYLILSKGGKNEKVNLLDIRTQSK